MRGRFLPVLLLSVSALACHPCDPVGDLRVGGDSPYVRCAELPPPAAGSRSVGGVSFQVDGRELRFAPSPQHVAFLRGPAPHASDLAVGLTALVGQGADVLFVLGGVGDDEAAAERTLRALAATERPCFVLGGGRDEAATLSQAFEALGDDAKGVVDARGLRVVHMGTTSLMLLSGAPEGRYARTDDACGFGSDDLDALGDSVPDTGPRYLISWASPASDLALGFDGVQAGEPSLSEFIAGAHLLGSVSAWPAFRAGAVMSGQGGQLSALAGALGAPHARSADGAVLPDHPLMLQLGSAGLSRRTLSPTDAAEPAAH